MSAYASSADGELETKEERLNSREGRLSPKPQRPARSCVVNPSREPLTEESLLKLEQAQPQCRLAQRNLDHWFFYIESTVQDTFDTYMNRRDKNFYPATAESESVVSLSQADFQESHHSPASSTDLFGFTVRSPPPDIQVVIPSRPVSIHIKTEKSSSPEWQGLSPSPERTQSPTQSPSTTPLLTPVPTQTPQFRPLRSSNRLPKKRSYVALSDTENS